MAKRKSKPDKVETPVLDEAERAGNAYARLAKYQREKLAKCQGEQSPDPTESPPPGITAPPLRLEWRSPEELADNPRNWKIHPPAQVAALTDIMAEVGWAGACLLNETTGLLLDGHARKKMALDQGAKLVPVLIGRWTPEQEAKILLTLDPIAAQAEADAGQLDALLKEVKTSSEALQQLMADLAAEAGLYQEPPADEQGSEQDITEQFQILVTCQNEPEQASLLERLTQEGLTCRSLIS